MLCRLDENKLNIGMTAGVEVVGFRLCDDADNGKFFSVTVSSDKSCSCDAVVAAISSSSCTAVPASVSILAVVTTPSDASVAFVDDDNADVVETVLDNVFHPQPLFFGTGSAFTGGVAAGGSLRFEMVVLMLLSVSSSVTSSLFDTLSCTIVVSTDDDTVLSILFNLSSSVFSLTVGSDPVAVSFSSSLTVSFFGASFNNVSAVVVISEFFFVAVVLLLLLVVNHAVLQLAFLPAVCNFDVLSVVAAVGFVVVVIASRCGIDTGLEVVEL